MKIKILIIIVISILSASVFAEVRYTITDLGTFGGITTARGLNDLGQVVGYSKLPNGDNRAFRWDPNETNGTVGAMVDLGILDGKTASLALGINNSGYVCGYCGPSNYIAFIHDGLQMIAILNDPTYDYTVTSINENGQIAGSRSSGSSQVVRWDPDYLGATTGTMIYLGTLAGGPASGTYINDNGQVCGWGLVPDPRGRVGFLSDPNESLNYYTTTHLDTTGGVGGTSYAFCVNNKQHAVGNDNVPGGARATIWYAYNRTYNPGLGCYNSPPITLGAGFLPGGNAAAAHSINESDEVVGYSESSKGLRAFYWSSSEGMIDLNDYIHPDSEWTLQYAKGINEIGQIVGYGINPDGQTRGFLLTPECQYDLPGDFDDNCKINIADLAVFASNWLTDCGQEPLNPDCALK